MSLYLLNKISEDLCSQSQKQGELLPKASVQVNLKYLYSRVDEEQDFLAGVYSPQGRGVFLFACINCYMLGCLKKERAGKQASLLRSNKMSILTSLSTEGSS